MNLNLSEKQKQLVGWLIVVIAITVAGYFGVTYPLPEPPADLPSTIEPAEEAVPLGVTNFLGLQVDSNNDTTTALTVNQTGTGDIVDFQDGGSSVWRLSDGGNIDQTGTFQFGSDDLYPLGFASSGQQAVYGTDTMTTTITVTHGLTTVTFCVATLGEDPETGAGDAAAVSVAVAGNNCVVKSWQDDFSAATETDVSVQWLVIGAP